jgi:rhodanese-related sulfurtransferase
MQTEIRTITRREIASRQARGEDPILIDVRSPRLLQRMPWNRAAGLRAQARA